MTAAVGVTYGLAVIRLDLHIAMERGRRENVDEEKYEAATIRVRNGIRPPAASPSRTYAHSRLSV